MLLLDSFVAYNIPIREEFELVEETVHGGGDGVWKPEPLLFLPQLFSTVCISRASHKVDWSWDRVFVARITMSSASLVLIL